MSAPPRRIAHLDMDAFYASVELLRYAELRGIRDKRINPAAKADGLAGAPQSGD